MLNETTDCCIRRYIESKPDSIQNLTVLYNVLKPCLDRNESIEGMLAYLLGSHEDEVICPNQQRLESLQGKDISNSSIAFTCFWVLIMIVAVLGNLTVCVVVYKTSSMRLILTNHFISSLAVSDLMVAVFLIPVKIDATLRQRAIYTSLSLCRYYATFDNVSFVASITNLLVITVDRFVAIVWPYRYQDIITKKRAKIAILLVWLYAIVIGALTNFNWGKNSSADNGPCWNQSTAYVTFIFCAVFYIPTVVMGAAHGKMLCIALQQSKKIASSRKVGEKLRRKSEEGDDIALQQKNIAARVKELLQEYKPVKVVLVVYGTFVACWLPVSIISLLQTWCSNCVTFQAWHIAVFVEVLPILNSTLNFFIYSAMNRQFRKACKRLLSRLSMQCNNWSY